MSHERSSFRMTSVLFIATLFLPSIASAADFVFPAEADCYDEAFVDAELHAGWRSIKSERYFSLDLRVFLSFPSSLYGCVGEALQKPAKARRRALSLFRTFSLLEIGYQLFGLDSDYTRLWDHKVYLFALQWTVPHLVEGRQDLLFVTTVPSVTVRFLEYRDGTEWKGEGQLAGRIELEGRLWLSEWLVGWLEPLWIGLKDQGDRTAFIWHVAPRLGFWSGDPARGFSFGAGPEFRSQGEQGPYWHGEEARVGGFVKALYNGLVVVRLMVQAGAITKMWEDDMGEKGREEYKGYYVGGGGMILF